MGICVMGNFENKKPSSAAINALKKLSHGRVAKKTFLHLAWGQYCLIVVK
ncbi:MAG: hypothetical protein IPO92_02470 [Saprospiraceae bacterium]|nr:hypothetical protein [Saprospiraceae bacterium]